ncbi:MAG: ATP-grasp domain-containing protein [Lachnospiraceae bacterium]|nr:ATP-grasp domain-containing protein [Lachnospiraceae bacterium]
MKAVIIGASAEALHTIEKAHAYGLSITALDGNPKAEGLGAADKALVVDISDENAAIEAVKRERPDFVLTVPIGRYLTTIGAVNDALKLPGISKETAVLCTDKYKFHQKLQERNLRNCHCYGAGSQSDETRNEELAENFLSGRLPLNFPVILKPRFGSGSRGIHMASDAEELKRALKAVEGESYVIEECIPGEEYGVDGAVIQGQFHMILLRKKENTPPPARQAVGYFSILPQDMYWQQVYIYMKKIVECLELTECLLHADMIRGVEGPFVIELSARPSGHNLHNLFTPLCTGIDMAEEYIRYRLGQPYSFTPACTKQMMIHYFDMEGSVTRVPDAEQLKAKGIPLICWNCNIKEGEELTPVSDGHSLMGRGYFILEGSNQAALLMQAEKIKRLFFL